MNAWEINKMVGAFLGTLLFGMALGLLAEAIFEEHPPEQPGYQIAVAEPSEGDDAGAAPAEEPFAALLAKADPQAGQRAAAVCQACHSFGEGEPNKVGPNLYGVVGAEVLHMADFNYSSAMREWGAGKRWNYDELDHFLVDPQGYIPGTTMGYAGIKDDQRRADVIVYLKSISPAAPPLPEPPAQTASTDAAADTTGTDAATTDTAGTDAATTDAPTTDAATTDAATTDAATTDAAATDTATTDAATTDTDAAATDAATATTDADGRAIAAAPAADTAATAQAGDAGDAGDAAGAGAADPFVALVAAADPARGERDAAICKACHTFEEGGPNRVGPNLYGIVGGAIVHSDSFAYSDAMKEYAEEHGTWTVGLLDAYLDAPAQTVPGTKMVFAGIKDEQRRAAIVAYLRSISPDAPPLEEAAAPAAPTTDTAAPPPADATATDAARSTDDQPTAAETAEPAAGQGAAPGPTDAPADATTDAAAEETTPAASTPAATDAEPSASEPPPAAAAATETSDGAETAATPPDSGSAPNVTIRDPEGEPKVTVVRPEGVGEAPPVDADSAPRASPAPSGDAATADGGDQTRDAADAAADPAGDGETEVAAAAAGDAASAADGAPASDAFARLVAASSPEAGQNAARICSACHSFEEGGANKVGPNLYGIVGGKVLLSDDYNYSVAMREFAAEHPTWTIALLDEYLEAPLTVVPGTKMAFAGIPDENRRAEVIAFLRSLSADPVPLAGADE